MLSFDPFSCSASQHQGHYAADTLVVSAEQWDTSIHVLCVFWWLLQFVCKYIHTGVAMFFKNDKHYYCLKIANLLISE